MVHYYRTTPDGRVALGKGGGRLAYGARIDASFTGSSPPAPRLAARMRLLYPFLAKVPIAASWIGPIDRTLDGLPFFTALGGPASSAAPATRVRASVPRCSGAGSWRRWRWVATTSGLGAGSARQPPAGMPPEPARFIGGNVVRNAVARKERAEDDGRPVAALDRKLAGLAPAGLVPRDSMPA